MVRLARVHRRPPPDPRLPCARVRVRVVPCAVPVGMAVGHAVPRPPRTATPAGERAAERIRKTQRERV